MRCNLLLLTLLILSCKKHVDTAAAAMHGPNPFGVLVNDTTPGTNNANFKLSVAGQYKVPYLRDAINLAGWNGVSDALYTAETNAGYKVLLNVNNALVVSGSPVPFPTDLVTYKTRLASLLTIVKPVMIVVENEETNRLYHVGPFGDYLGELQAAIDVAHGAGLPVTNGGITAQVVFLVYRDYYSRGLYAEAADYASRTMSPSIIADLPALANHAALAAKVDSTQYLVNNYKVMALDYVNLHWYEPIADNYVATAPYYGTKAFRETVDYLRRATGKDVITNEIGQDNTVPDIATDLMQAVLDAKIKYAVWYDGDGNSAFGLHAAGTTALRPNGQAFARFIANTFQ